MLTSAYHQTLSWRLKKQYEAIDDEILRRAKILATYNVHSEDMKLNISLKARYIDCNGKIKTATIKKYKASAYSFQQSRLIANKQKINNLVFRWIKKMSIDEVVDIYATMGRASAPCFASEDLVECMNQKVNGSYTKSLQQYLMGPEKMNVAAC